MKKVLVLFGKSDWKKKYKWNEDYMYSYGYFYDLCAENGMEIYRASYKWYDYKNNIFKYAWKFNRKDHSWERVYGVGPDLIFDKVKYNTEAYYRTELINKHYKFFNSLEFTKIIDDKINTGILFSEWSKPSWFINSRHDLEKALGKIGTEMAVIKPINASGGYGVVIGTKERIVNKVDDDMIVLQNFIVQEFVDSSKGIPGITEGIHDLRMVMVDDKIAYSYVRKPAEGSYLANLAQGGKKEIIRNEDLPESLLPILEKAKRIFSTFTSKLYTIDVMFDEESRPWIIELNSMPGAHFEKGQEEAREIFYRELLEIFKRELSE